MDNYLVIAVDPSKIGGKTSGTGISAGVILNNKYITIFSEVVLGKEYQTQTQYNQAVCKLISEFISINGIQNDNVLIRIEEYVDYQKAATKYATNGVAEMIGAIKLTFEKDYAIVMRKAQVIKTRWDSVVLKKMGIMNDAGSAINNLEVFDGKIIVKPLAKFYTTYRTKHEYDAYRHLIDELYFGQWGKEKWRKK